MKIGRIIGLLIGLLMVSACALPKTSPKGNMGDFDLIKSLAIEKNAKRGPLSRKAEDGMIKEGIDRAMHKELGHYSGGKRYYIATHVDGYLLAVPGVPVLYSPKSALIVSVTLWDGGEKPAPTEDGDAQAEKPVTPVKVNAEPKVFTILETASGKTFLGSGLTQSKEEQLANLTKNLAIEVHEWLLDNPEWFGLPAGTNANRQRVKKAKKQDATEADAPVWTKEATASGLAKAEEISVAPLDG
ncbi:MAG: hypothetical protein ACPGVK_10350 [Halocynthiibacter sp.]